MNNKKQEKNILETFKRKIAKIIPADSGPLLIALSGGGDSLALASMLLEIRDFHNRELIAFHLDHGLRGDESSADAEFVRRWCKNKKLKIKFEKAVDLEKLRSKNNLSIEEAAREYRYFRLIEYAKKKKASAIVTGHTLDDDVETFLLRIGTGGSLKSLSGIPEVSTRDGVLILRPLLSFSREELRKYLKSRNESWREDSSNLTPTTLRNKVRLKIIPFLNEIFERDVRETIGRTLKNLKRENNFIESLISEQGIIESYWMKFSSKWKKGYEGSSELLASFHPSLQNRIILWALNDLGLPIKRRKADIFNMAGQFLNLSGGKRYHNIGKNIYIARSGKAFIIAKGKRIPYESEFDPEASNAEGYIREACDMVKKDEKKITKPGIYKMGDFEITVETVDRTEVESSKSKTTGEVVEYFDPSILEGGFELVSGATITGYECSPGSEKVQKEFKTLGNKTLVDHWVKWPVLKKDNELIWIVGVSRRKVYKLEESKKVIRIKVSLPSNFRIYL